MAENKKSKTMALIDRIMKPIASTLAGYAKKSDLNDAIDEVKNNAVVKDMPVSVEDETLVFEETAEALIEGDTLIIGE